MKKIVVLIIIMLSTISVKGQTFRALRDADSCFNAADYDCSYDKYLAYQRMSARQGTDVTRQINISKECSNAIRVADSLYNLKNFEDAQKDYFKVISLNSGDSHAKQRYNLCWKEITEKNWEEGNKCFKEANYECAVDNYEAYKKAPKDFQLMDVTKKIEDAIACRNSIKNANSYFDLKMFKEALLTYEIVLSRNPYDQNAKERKDICVYYINLQSPTTTQPSTTAQTSTRAQNSTPSKPKSPNKNFEKIGGRDLSYGFSTGTVSTNFITGGVSGDYIGSVINYGLSGKAGIPRYKSKVGFNVGIILDRRIYNNLYLQTGLNYVNEKVKNDAFSHYYYVGHYMGGYDIYMDLKERYKLNYFEIPLLFSFRFKLSEETNLQINLGPYLGYGFSGKCISTGSVYSRDANNTATDRIDKIKGEIYLFSGGGKVTTSYIGENRSDPNTVEYNTDSPFKRTNAGMSFGTTLESNGLFIGFSYDWGMVNIANDAYWSSDRMTFNPKATGHENLEGYQHKLNKIQIKIGYIYRWE